MEPFSVAPNKEVIKKNLKLLPEVKMKMLYLERQLGHNIGIIELVKIDNSLLYF